MSEANLLSFGCGISFIVIAAVYVFARECFSGASTSRQEQEEELAPQRVASRQRLDRRG